MNLKNLALLFCIFAVHSVAGQAASFIAVSNISQDDANTNAIYGVFKQQGFDTDAIKQIRHLNSNKSSAGLFLKEIRTDQGYKAQAILDIDFYLADLQTKINDLQRDISTLKNAVEYSISNRLYAVAAKDLELAQIKRQDLKHYLGLYASTHPLNHKNQFKPNLSELEMNLLERLSGITFESSTPLGTFANPEIPSLKIRVTDVFGPLPNFPLAAKQDKIIAEGKTLANGEISFFLQNLDFSEGDHELIIEPGLPPLYLKKFINEKKLQFFYTIRRDSNIEHLLCARTSSYCSMLKDFFENHLTQKNEEDPPQMDLSKLTFPKGQR